MADGNQNMAQMALLVPYGGEKPPAPAWFERAVATPYETRWVEVDGANIRYQRWGDPAKPGLLMVHGNGAHAHWYDFIAPFFAEDYCVVAMSFGGMGDSDWREAYSLSSFTAEQLAVCEHAGLFDHDRKPMIIAHSFGGYITLSTGGQHSDRFAGMIIVDSVIRHPEDEWDGPPQRGNAHRIYADLKTALSRFRLAPPQTCENHYIIDYIARHSLKEVTNSAGQTGWNWKFDPSLWTRFESMDDPATMFRKVTCPLSVIRGENSVLVDERNWTYMRSLRDDVTFVSMPEAAHHLLLDQPLAFVSVLRTQLAAWAY